MGKIRRDIIHTATHEAEKNKFIFFNEISEIKVYSTHAKAWVTDRTDGDGDLQPILLVNSDSSNMPRNVKEDYGVLVLTSNASRYEEAVGILVRKKYSSFVDDIKSYAGDVLSQPTKPAEDILKTTLRLVGFNLR